jgi:protein-tyrosine-phosphatase
MFGQSIYVGSAGVRKGELDPFAVAAMAEIGIDISRHKPVTFEELDEWEGLNFDLIVTLAPEAHHRALELTRTSGVEVEYWPTRMIRPPSKAAASSGSTPTGRCATSFWRGFGSVSSARGQNTGNE